MAARKRSAVKGIPMPQRWRDKISVSIILDRLEKNALGTLVDIQSRKPVTMSTSQVKSAEILLKKILPDLSENKTELTGPVTVVINKPK